jgi:hypothetical protein
MVWVHRSKSHSQNKYVFSYNHMYYCNSFHWFTSFVMSSFSLQTGCSWENSGKKHTIKHIPQKENVYSWNLSQNTVKSVISSTSGTKQLPESQFSGCENVKPDVHLYWFYHQHYTFVGFTSSFHEKTDEIFQALHLWHSVRGKQNKSTDHKTLPDHWRNTWAGWILKIGDGAAG